ncbi:hypothetical protein D5b_00238 [Faustovirus]|nr:hypothetical protein D5b_00238 [Faustovirus]AMN84676.1 hypothetical protein D6_00273 [Faustovirus]
MLTYHLIKMQTSYIRAYHLPMDRQINIDIINLIPIYIKYFPNTNFVNAAIILASKVMTNDNSAPTIENNIIPSCDVFAKYNDPTAPILVLFREVYLIVNSLVYTTNGTPKYTVRDVKDLNIDDDTDKLYLINQLPTRELDLAELLTLMTSRNHTYATKMLQQLLPIADIYELILCANLEPLEISNDNYAKMLCDDIKYFDACFINTIGDRTPMPIHSLVLRMGSAKLSKALQDIDLTGNAYASNCKKAVFVDCDINVMMDLHNVFYLQQIGFEGLTPMVLRDLIKILINADMITMDKISTHFLHGLLYRNV